MLSPYPIPIKIPNVGSIRIPRLLDIRELGFEVYQLYINLLYINLDEYYNIVGLEGENNLPPRKDNKQNTFFNMVVCSEDFKELYKVVLDFFFAENVVFSHQDKAYYLWKYITNTLTGKREAVITGSINNDNFETVRECLLEVNCVSAKSKKDKEEKPVRYKNKTAEKLHKRMLKAQEEREKNNKDFDLTLGDMISKYCADNKNGINILNVYEMTIYQFYDQWIEHNNIRQINLQDSIYANTVNIADTEKYNTQLWLKTIN